MVSLAKLHKYFEMSKKDLKIQEYKDLNIQKFKLFSAKMSVLCHIWSLARSLCVKLQSSVASPTARYESSTLLG